MTEKRNIKPCPFCGGEAELAVRRFGAEDIDRYAVHCGPCFVCSVWAETEEQAVNWWNRRAETTAGRATAGRDETEEPRVLPLEEILDGCGNGWAEQWYAPDPEEGEPETFEIRPCAWAKGCVTTGESEISTPNMVKRNYGNKYGMRIWDLEPTREQAEATPWTRE